jgi:hypothetical protein
MAGKSILACSNGIPGMNNSSWLFKVILLNNQSHSCFHHFFAKLKKIQSFSPQRSVIPSESVSRFGRNTEFHLL